MHQLPKRSFFSLVCLLLLAVTANAQTEKRSGPTVIEPPAEQTRQVAGRTSLYCAGYIRFQRLPKTPEIVGATQESEQNTFASGNVVYLNAGLQQGVKEGQNFQIIRPRGDVKGVYRQKKGFLGTYVQEVGQLQVFKVRERMSMAQITYSCDTVLLGDLLMDIPSRVSPLRRPESSFDQFAEPTGKQTGRLMMSHDGHEMVTTNDIVFIDLGAEDKVNAGEYLTIYRPLGTGNLTRVDNEESARGRATGFQSDRYRGGGVGIQAQRAKDSTFLVNGDGRYRYRPITTKGVKRNRPEMPRRIVGEMVIIDVQARTATAIITRAVAEVHTGDWVEIQ